MESELKSINDRQMKTLGEDLDNKLSGLEQVLKGIKASLIQSQNHLIKTKTNQANAIQKIQAIDKNNQELQSKIEMIKKAPLKNTKKETPKKQATTKKIKSKPDESDRPSLWS
mmetsp:Transcript_9628/g.14482  ORF Transcript_9628/g.14482 Transcript_9628/m.14482 type:complete len:113 (+) Transcript_9628:104-442(+)